MFELLVVLLILTLALALSGSLYFRSNAALQGEFISKAVASELRKTRSVAIAENTNLQWMQSDFIALLNENANARDKVSFNFSPNGSAENRSAAFTFYSDGSANGGVIRIETLKRSWDIRVGLSGRVTIDEQRQG